MSKMWAVSSGEYSDYGVICLCATEELANRIVEQIGHDGYGAPFVEEFDIATTLPTPSITLRLECFISDTGQVIERAEHRYTHWVYEFDEPPKTPPVEWRWFRSEYGYGYKYGTKEVGGELQVYGVDHERVQRVYSDRKAELLALDHMRQTKTLAKNQTKGST